MMLRREGLIFIDREALFNNTENYAETFSMLKFIPLKVEQVGGEKPFFIFGGISYLFDEIEIGEEIPVYEIKITDNRDGTQNFEAIRN